MMSSEGSNINDAFLLDFRSPIWFANSIRLERLPGEICWYHEAICDMVERDMLVLRRRQCRQSRSPQTAEEEEEEEEEIRKKKEIEYMRRNEKIKKFWRIKQEENRKEEEKRKQRRCSQRLMNQKWLKEWKEKKERRKELFKMVLGSLHPPEFLSKRPRLKKVWTFQRNAIYDISLLLSGGERRTRRTDGHYLVRNNGEQVNIDQLHGKYVLLYFWSLPDDPGHTPHEFDPRFDGDLREVYHIYNPRGEFEVVFVALGDNKDVFHDSFSLMPWLAIPHEDKLVRDFLEIKFAIPSLDSAKAVLFAPDGTLLHGDAAAVFSTFGSQFFPFTSQRIQDISYECATLQDLLFSKKQKPSLTALLGNYLISCDGEEVPTSELEGEGEGEGEGKKIVGLYFFEPTSGGFQTASQLLEIWKLLKDDQHAFQIVLINKDPFNLSDAKAEFRKKFGCIPWYTLPACGRKLCRVFEKGLGKVTDLAGDFIVLQPDRYQPLSYFAFKILEMFGVDAYPFTLERAVELAKRKQQNELVLGQLLSPEAPLRRGGSACYKEDTTVSKLSGKRVLLLFATHSCYKSGLFLPELKRIYEKKEADDDFEIIYISLDCDESPSSFSRSIQGMPWLVHSFVPDFAVSLAQQVFYAFTPHLPAIAAFGPDGHLETKESNVAFKEDWNPTYPFIRADMDEVVHMELLNLYKWDLERLANSDIYGLNQSL